jgi:Dolichyl-phosphate-mannose-protein mannosyltransferase
MTPEKKIIDYRSTTAILFYIALSKLFLLVIWGGNYGFFRDEFYYIECSKHLAFGYVDQPPLSILLLAVSRTLFGESILAIRIFSYITGSATVFVSGLIARELNGKRFAQILTALSALFCGVMLGVSNFFSMNSLDILFSATALYLIIRLIKSNDKRIWYPIGIVFGLGLENKLSFLFLGFGLAAGMLLTKERKYYLCKELYLAVLTAFLLFLPNIIWQIANHYPTLEFMRNASAWKIVRMTPLQFFLGSLMELNPAYIVLLASAVYFLFIDRDGKKFALIGLVYIVLFTVFVINHGKPYYMGIIYPAVIGAGAVGAEVLIERYLNNWARSALVLYLILSYGVVLPFSVPVLPVDSFIKYSEFLGIKQENSEKSKLGLLPQYYSDRFGWEEMVESVALVYKGLSEEEKKKTVIFAQDYGQAGAIGMFGKKYGLPEVFSTHNNYWLWGPPNDWDGSIAIVVGSNMHDNLKFFGEVDLAAFHYNKYGMPFENVSIFICRRAKAPAKEFWPKIKNFI